jgi:hypothetical protein
VSDMKPIVELSDKRLRELASARDPAAAHKEQQHRELNAILGTLRQPPVPPVDDARRERGELVDGGDRLGKLYFEAMEVRAGREQSHLRSKRVKAARRTKCARGRHAATERTRRAVTSVMGLTLSRRTQRSRSAFSRKSATAHANA